MPYVQRNAGKVCGIYANAQPGYAEEFLPDDSAEVLEYLNPTLGKEQQIAKILAVRGLTLDSEWQLYAAIAGMQAAASTQGKTEAQLYASNPGYKNAKDLFLAVAAIRAAP